MSPTELRLSPSAEIVLELLINQAYSVKQLFMFSAPIMLARCSYDQKYIDWLIACIFPQKSYDTVH